MGTNQGGRKSAKDAEDRALRAIQADTFEEAMAIYGTRPEQFWKQLRKMGMEDDTRAKYGKPVRGEAAVAAMVEDAEFLAMTGEHPDNAVRRLGFSNIHALERALNRAGRYDIMARLCANDGLGTLGMSHHSQKALSSSAA